MADLERPIFKLNLGGIDRLFISTQSLLNEICDEKRFTKIVSGGLEQVRNGVGDGLFTARHGEENWELAHRVLMPGVYHESQRQIYMGN
ncbi:hypothetical protein NHQ30_011063 [Ciborinia camelliae]|nr:hypothetical protein NHQ30_011063 [Ciborinia camelliae]